ncbi:cytochrome c oxidase subunit 3 [Blyttiomyces helicus]|uniref:Cytochrome c oxidase subunit 3 n=1 Tax=Blyttiomyces helicus TaxID=388810 RepID=A0A4V1IST1_9FUNG|nr:cytochrome c oxidase subunit 3 [Blyttiomyces helicus]|eukprot:RKO94637.1 cytochrome c oxidase subunit 3 [Blyttiomyces helicus]
MRPFHLVDLSPWPLLASVAVLSFATALVSWFHGLPSLVGAASGAAFLLLVAFQWWRDVLREARGGHHTVRVQNGILVGFLLFLLSEIMLFVSFFWAFFHSALAPAVELAALWPPVGVATIDPWSIPLLGSCVLLASGFVLTLGHHALLNGSKALGIASLVWTVVLGGLFLFLQFNEYSVAGFTIADSVYGSVFYMTTGLHAVHVFIGVLFLTVGLVRLVLDHFTVEHHAGMEFAIFYWHLVDVVWLFVFVSYYWWGGA